MIRHPAQLTPWSGIQHHRCEHPGCGKNAGWGFAKPRQMSHWFCFEHRALRRRALPLRPQAWSN
ncbi:MAG: hypothetical protein EOR82_26130 [Mesorhizobium sp.]|nr:MAG: hypothetical protein EOR82_26130 [Mesorhizobium sp.]TJV55694.1 MAG: hypothetical protein E5X82_26395 [Mesorhizobium sp.]